MFGGSLHEVEMSDVDKSRGSGHVTVVAVVVVVVVVVGWVEWHFVLSASH